MCLRSLFIFQPFQPRRQLTAIRGQPCRRPCRVAQSGRRLKDSISVQVQTSSHVSDTTPPAVGPSLRIGAEERPRPTQNEKASLITKRGDRNPARINSRRPSALLINRTPCRPPTERSPPLAPRLERHMTKRSATVLHSIKAGLSSCADHAVVPRRPGQWV